MVRSAIEREVRREESELRRKDGARIAWASLKMDEPRRSVEGWSRVEEIRRWKERKVVIDASVAAKWFIEEEYTREALMLKD